MYIAFRLLLFFNGIMADRHRLFYLLLLPPDFMLYNTRIFIKLIGRKTRLVRAQYGGFWS